MKEKANVVNVELLVEAMMAQAVSDLGTLLLLEDAGLGGIILGEEIPDIPEIRGTVHSARLCVEDEIRSMLDRWCPNKDTEALLNAARRTAHEKADTEVVYTALGWATVSGRP